MFRSYDECFSFYELYAEASGFDAKKSSQNRYPDGSVSYKVFRCTKSGSSQKLDVDTLMHATKDVVNRKSSSIKTGCDATIRCMFLRMGIVGLVNFFRVIIINFYLRLTKSNLWRKGD